MSPAAIRIAVLACDIPVPAVQAKLGGYGDCFKSLLKAGLAAKGYASTRLDMSVYDVVNSPSYPDLDDIDALLLTGSRHTAYHDDQWILDLVEFTRQAYNEQKRIIGVCFGHQILARALGARVEGNDKGWEISACDFDLTEDGSRLFDGQSTMTLHQMHRDIVAELPTGCVNLGRSSVCGIQGFYRPRRAITVQAHPEFNEFIISEIVKVRREQGIFGAEQAQDALGRASRHHDGLVAAKAMITFLFDDE